MRLFLVLFLLAPQEGPGRLVEELADPSPVTRDDAARKLIEGYPAFRKGLEAALAATKDVDLQARLRDVLRDGRLRELRLGFAPALPERVRKEFPGLADALYSREPALREKAFRALFGDFDQSPFVGLYLSPGELGRLLPHLQAALDPAPEFERTRIAWALLLCTRDGLLERPDWLAAARALLEDPSEHVRNILFQNKMAARLVPAEDFAELARNAATLPDSTRRRVLTEIAARKLEAHYGAIEDAIGDPLVAPLACDLVLRHGLASLRPRAAAYVRSHPGSFSISTVELLTREEATPLLLDRVRAEPPNGDALRMLGTRGTAAAADIAAAYLTHSDWRIRAAALQAVAGIGGPAQAGAVARLLRESCELPKDDLTFDDTAAWRLLIEWRAGEEIGGLFDLLPRINPFGVDLPAAVATLHVPAKKLVPLLRSKSPYDAGRALELLAAAGAVAEARENLDAIRALFDLKDPPMDQLYLAAGRLRLTELLPVLLDRVDRSSAARAAFRLYWTPEERRAALRDPDPKLRGAAALASGDDDLALLQPLVRDPDSTVRRRVAESVLYRADIATSPLLLELAKDADPAVAAAAAKSFFWWNRDETEKAGLEGLLRHPSREIRLGAVRFIDRSFALAHAELVRELLRDPEVGPKIPQANAFLDPETYRKTLETIEKGETAHEVFSAVTTIPYSLSPEEAGRLLLRLYERALRPGTTLEREETVNFGHGSTVFDLASVLSRAAWVAATARGTDLEPVLTRMLATDRPALQSGAAEALGRLGCRGAIPRLTELAAGPDGKAAAEALGMLRALPKELLAHADPKVRANAVHAASIAKDPAHFEALLEAARSAQDKSFQEALETLVRIAPRGGSVRILELGRRANSEERSRVFLHLHALPEPELVEPVAEYLEGAYGERHSAASLLVALGADKYAEKIARAMGDYAAPAIRRFGLRGHVGPILKWLEVPGNPVMDSTAVDVAITLASLGLKEHLPAVVEKMKSIRPDERKRMLLPIARLGGRDALLDELRRGSREMQLAAAEALLATGEVEAMGEIRRVAVEQLASAQTLVLAIGDRELAELYIREHEKRGARGLLIPLAVGDRLRVEWARPRLARLIREDPEAGRNLITAWTPLPWEVDDPGNWWHYRTARETVQLLSRQMKREVVFGTPPEEGFLDRFVAAGTMNLLLSELPYPASAYVDAQGRLVIDTLDRVRRGWLERLEKR